MSAPSTKPPSSANANKEVYTPSSSEAHDAHPASDLNSRHLHGVNLALVLLATYLSVLCVALDNTIIATAVPTITDRFHSVDQVGWYGSAYLLCEAGFQLLFGKVYTLFNTKRVFLVAIALFEIGSAVCASAPSSTAFIIGRAISGVGSAGIFSGAILIIVDSTPLKRRPIYVGAFGAMYGVASVTAPLIGGALTTHASWRWCFYINIPLGAMTVLFIMLVYKSKKMVAGSHDVQGWRERLALLDFLGTAVFLPAVICLLLALQWGGTTYKWSNWRIILLLVVCLCLAVMFCLRQWQKQDGGTLPPKIVRQRSVAAAAWFGFCIVGSMFSMVYFLPIWFQAIQGVDALQSGLRNIPLIFSLVVASTSAGVLVSTLVGYYNPFVLASSLLASLGAGMMCLFNVHSKADAWIGFQLMYGIGVGFGMQQALLVVQTVLPDADVPIGTALINFAQTLGGAMSVSVASNVFDNNLRDHLGRVAPEIDSDRLIAAGATGIRDLVPGGLLSGVLQAYNQALLRAFMVPMGLAALSTFGALALEWKSVKKDEGQPKP